MTPVAVPQAEIKSVNGAGDSFAGGFLAGLFVGKDPKKAIRYGNYAATTVIRRPACDFPLESPKLE